MDQCSIYSFKCSLGVAARKRGTLRTSSCVRRDAHAARMLHGILIRKLISVIEEQVQALSASVFNILSVASAS